MHDEAQALHLPSLRSVAEETVRIVTVPYRPRKVVRAQPAKVVLSKIAVVHEERQICFGKLAILLESGDKVTTTLIETLRSFVNCGVVNIQQVR